MASPKNSKSSKAKDPNKTLKPVLIIPGFMSSVLTVQSSTLKPSWKDQRLWLNISTLGFNSIKRGGKLQRNEDIRSKRILDAEKTGKKEAQDSTLEEMHAEFLKQIECKNRWVQHMKLGDDLTSERKGVIVRALEGTAGVDYLSEGALTESMSYVFGPVLKLLRSTGYEDGVNLDAAPYDWRIPPRILETRDSYFSRTITKIERLYHINKNTPVVILSHSMGCRASHYLFNFVIHTKGEEEGMRWLDKFIDCWVPVGAPYLGTPTSIRCMMTGDKMGLDAFLSDFEGLCLARSFGSPPWLFPLERDPKRVDDASLLLYQKASMATSFVRLESALYITIPSQRLNLECFFTDRKSYPNKVRLTLNLGKCTIKTNHYGISKNKPFIEFDRETWIVPCPLDINSTAKLYPTINVCIDTPGAGLPKKRERGICDFDIFCPVRLIFCILKWLLCCPCALLSKFCACVSSGAMQGFNAGASALGSHVVLGASEPLLFGKTLIESDANSADIEEGSDRSFYMGIDLIPCESDDSLCRGICYLLFWQHPHTEKLRINFKWESKSMNSWTEHVPLSQRSRKYISCDTHQLLKTEGMSRVFSLLENSYVDESDPVGPLSKSSWHAPPVKRVISIYGINYPTEVSAVYRRNSIKHLPNAANKTCQFSELELEPTFVLEVNAALDNVFSKTHIIKKGLILETSKSPQTVITADGTKSVEFKSGDGSVPYWSLQHCRMWQGRGPAKCDVTVHEIDSVEHRAILNDSRFHNILLELLGLTIA